VDARQLQCENEGCLRPILNFAVGRGPRGQVSRRSFPERDSIPPMIRELRCIYVAYIVAVVSHAWDWRPLNNSIVLAVPVASARVCDCVCSNSVVA
jgi:hypothetical protein